MVNIFYLIFGTLTFAWSWSSFDVSESFSFSLSPSKKPLGHSYRKLKQTFFSSLSMFESLLVAVSDCVVNVNNDVKKILLVTLVLYHCMEQIIGFLCTSGIVVIIVVLDPRPL